MHDLLLSVHLHEARLTLDAAHRDFLRKAIPWIRATKPRSKTSRDANTDAVL